MALLHMEVAKVYAEVALLPELRPEVSGCGRGVCVWGGGSAGCSRSSDPR